MPKTRPRGKIQTAGSNTATSRAQVTSSTAGTVHQDGMYQLVTQGLPPFYCSVQGREPEREQWDLQVQLAHRLMQWATGVLAAGGVMAGGVVTGAVAAGEGDINKPMSRTHVGAQNFSSAYFGEGCGSTVLGNLHCVGNELTPQRCPRTPGSTYRDCEHLQDAGVRCVLTSKEPTVHRLSIIIILRYKKR